MRAYGQYAAGAYSASSLEQVIGALHGAAVVNAPLSIQISCKARQYAGPGLLEAAVHASVSNFPEVTIALHLDHGDGAACVEYISSGEYSSVMIDASRESLEGNIATTRRVADLAHACGMSVEAELGRLGGKGEEVVVDASDEFLTDPSVAAEFVGRSGCDSLAVAVGTSHGLAKYTVETGLSLDRLAAIQELLPGFPLVLHGSSSVPQSEVRRIIAAGGGIDPRARGVTDDEYRRAVPLGATKINVDADGRLVWTRVQREFLRDHPKEVDF